MGELNTNMSGSFKATSLRLPVEILSSAATEAAKRGMTQTDFIVEALREKFERIKTGQDCAWGPLSRLSEKDRARAVKFIECLHAAPKSAGFRKAVDANFSWLMDTVKTRKKS